MMVNNKALKLLLISAERFKRFDRDLDFSKIDTNLEPGEKVKIIWDKNYNDIVDIGYVIEMPGMDYKEGDVIIHIPKPSGGQKSQEPPEWVYLYELLENKFVLKIRGADE